MRVWITSLTTAIVLSLACVANAHTPPAGSPLAARAHPRLWLTSANLPALRAKLSADFRSEYQTFVRELDGRIGASKNWGEWELDMLNFAFVHQMGPVTGVSYGHAPTAYGQRAKQMLMELAADRQYTSNAPLVYDWVFDLMSSGERASVVNVIKMYADGTGGSQGNPYNGNDILQRTTYLLAGLAFWGDGIDDGAADAMVSRYYSLIEGPDGVLGAGSFYAGDDGGWSMGLNYSMNVGTGLAMPRLMEAWATANGYSRAQVFTAQSANVVRYYPQWILYNILPPTSSCSSCPGGYTFPMYRSHASNTATTAIHGFGSYFPATIAALRLYKSADPGVASLVQWLLDNRLRPLGSGGYDGQAFAVFSHFVAGEKNIPSKSPPELGLPLTKHFTNSGWVVMRTGFGNPSDTMVTFMASPWSRASGTYTNYNQGSFTIDRRGPLALNAGAGVHHDYSKKATWAYNTMIFPDPGEGHKGEWWDKGGQRLNFPMLYGSSQLTQGSPHDLKGITRFIADAAYDYIFADVTRAYNGPASSDGINSSKVGSFTRQFVYFRRQSSNAPDQIVVFDRALTTDTRFQKRWLLHPSASTGGITVNGSLVTATNTANGSNGTLYSNTLLPAQHNIVVIGGPGHEYEDPYGWNDTNNVIPGTDPQYAGTHRVEVRPAVPSTYDTFLHVLEATDAGSGPTASALLTGSGMVAARVGQRIAAFSQNETDISSGHIVMDQAGTFSVVICDLTPGATYDVSGRAMTASSAGTISADVSSAGAGSRITVTRGGSSAQAPPAAPSNVQLIRVAP